MAKKMEKKHAETMPQGLKMTNEELNQRMFDAGARQLRQLNKDKTKNLGLFEAIHLWLLGRREGKHGLVRCEEGNWTSPFIRQERERYDEYCKRVWGSEHIFLERIHSQCEPLLASIARQEQHLADVLETYKPAEPSFFLSRKLGEEKLSDSQVQARRAREDSARLARIKAEADAIENAMNSEYERLAILHSHIVDSEDAARLICQRVLSHTRLKIQALYRAALVVSADGGRMPVAPTLPDDKEAEMTYMAHHQQINRTIETTLERRSLRLAEHQAADIDVKEVA